MQLTIGHIAGAIIGTILALSLPMLADAMIWALHTPIAPIVACIALVVQQPTITLTPEPAVIDLSDPEYLAVLLSGEVYS